MSGTVPQNFAQFLTQLRGVWQYRWHAAALTWIICVAGWIGVTLTPDRYQASARVHVDTPSILGPLLVGLTVQPNLEQQLAMMTRTLLSRPNIERVIDSAGLDNTPRTASEKEFLIDRLAKGIEMRGADQDNLYTITYSDRSPENARRVVQTLLNMLVETSVGEKRTDSTQAQEFLSEQIAAYERRLSDAEHRLRDFKQKNLGFTPGQDFFTRLNETAAALNAARLELREAQNGLDALRGQIASSDATGDGAPEVPANPDLDARIQALRKNLDNLRLTLTEQHPDVVGNKRVLDELEAQRVKERAAARRAPSEGRVVPRANNIALALAEAESNVASLRVRVGEYEKRYNTLRAAADRTPQVEAEYVQLNRDYEVNKQNFEKLLARRESAHISQEVDTKRGGGAFRVVDPPRVPLAPTSPNRLALDTLVLLLGLAGGVAFAVLLSQIRPTFSDRRTLAETTGLPILGVVTRLWTPAQRRRQRAWMYALTGAYAGLLAAYGGIITVLLLSTRGGA